ncbi:hypothetical protein GH714_021227 [Hevea brasiliensis]|uniref:Peptidase A2 domain-containing protein n=1 Tax=Hevea brasiliensis TaxID=3981 RepID=A0A6A6LTW2_HEVBR|nr:hypothetical protein GH714_021227 [Hevea brasiliensis]
MLVKAGVQGTPIVALVDTGADTLYMSTQLADEIKLPYEKVQGSVKGMIAESMPISGVAKNVSLQIGQWQGKVDITIAPLNEKKLYLGIDFLREVQALLVPYADTMCIMQHGQPYYVPIKREARAIKFIVKIDNVATSYFQTQKKLSPKQANSNFLAEFDFKMEYKPGKANLIADVLSRKGELADISQPTSNPLERIKQGLEHDPIAKSYISLVKEGKTRSFGLRTDCFSTRDASLCASTWQRAREILRECHDSHGRDILASSGQQPWWRTPISGLE